MRALVIAALIAAALVAWTIHPVCRPMDDASLSQFYPLPIEQRTDRELWWRIFQRRDGQWYHCKSWIGRKLFF